MHIKNKLLLTTIISASFLASSAAANVAYSENALSTQTILAQVGYLPPTQVNGYMDANTRNAISSFQAANGLQATGMIDPKTAEVLNAKYFNSPLPQTAPTAAPPAPAAAAVYSSNSLAIQQILYKLGFLQAAPNGYMDAQTRTAITNFQKAARLPASGEIDQATATAMNKAHEMGGVNLAAGVKRSAQEPYVKNTGLFASNKLAWTAGSVAVAGGAALAFSGGGSDSSSSSAIGFNIASNDAGNQAFSGTFTPANFDNPRNDVASSFLTVETDGNEGIENLKANFAHARGYDGRVYNRTSTGALQNNIFDDYVIVGVVDSGVDTDHPDLVNNLLLDYDQSCTATGCTAGSEDTDGHGTQVAGVIAAERNNIGTSGIAPRAKILPLKDDGSTEGAIRNIAYANNLGVDVFNNSYGYNRPIVTATSPGAPDPIGAAITAGNLRTFLTTPVGGTSFLSVLQQGVANDSIFVWSAGNNGANQSDFMSALPFYFAGTANAVNVEGYDWSNHWVNSISVDDSNVISSFSNQCGVTMNWCLAAPGEIANTTDLNGTYTPINGTSFSAPNVSGAIAVLLGAYPHLEPETVLQILFETATDLGVAGTDAVYGRGLIDLDAATNPVGNSADWTVAVNQNSSFLSFSSTGLNLSSAFGDAMAQNGQRIMFQDKFGKDYQVALSSLVGTVQEQTSNHERLAEFGKGSFAQEVSLGKNSDISFTLNPANESNLRSSLSDISTRVQNKFLLKQSFSPSMNATLGYNVNAADMLGYAAFAESEKDNLQISDAFKSPYLNLTEYANGAAAGYEFANFGVRVAGFEAQDQQEEYAFSDGNKTAGNMTEVYYADDDFAVSLQAGSARETNTFLGSEAGGALELDAQTPTYFAGIAASYSPFKDVTIQANYNTGTTNLDTASSSLISDVSAVESDSFAIGLLVDNIYAERDSFGVSVSQPLRINSASASALLPQDVNVDGSILYEQAQLNLSPVGRELDLEAYYDMALSEKSQLSVGSMLRLEPNHVEDADDEGLLLLKYKTDF